MVELINLQMLLKQLRNLQSVDLLQDIQELRTLQQQPRIVWQQRGLAKPLKKLPALKLALKNLALRALLVKHLACAQASLT